MKIGIAITTHNRNVVALKTLSILRAWLPENAVLICVDDASHIPFEFANYRFEQNVGVAIAKNKCLELLFKAGCTDYFLFDDDCYPLFNEWWLPYVNSGLKHACWNLDRKLIKTHQVVSLLTNHQKQLMAYNEYEKPNGCMLYCKSNVLHIVGGFDTEFIGYGYDHVNWSDRIFNVGLTRSRYIDIVNSEHLFAMAECESSFITQDRAMIPRNYELYQQKFYSKEFKPFK